MNFELKPYDAGKASIDNLNMPENMRLAAHAGLDFINRHYEIFEVTVFWAAMTRQCELVVRGDSKTEDGIRLSDELMLWNSFPVSQEYGFSFCIV